MGLGENPVQGLARHPELARGLADAHSKSRENLVAKELTGVRRLAVGIPSNRHWIPPQ
jgi:hypothetical protein